MIEESRTNILTYSDITSGEGLGTGWAIGGNRASKGSNATAPDGTLSAWNSVYNGTSGDASLYKVGGEVTTSNSTVYTLSIFAKVPSTNTHIVGVRIRTYNDNHSATFNLLTGTIVGGVEGTTTRRMEAYPNGWYRCSITFTSGTDGNQGVQYYMTNPSNSTSLNDSNANGEEIYYWGAQMEEGNFPTSYVPTSANSVTRGADIAIIKGTNFTDFYNQTEGTFLVESSSQPAKAGKKFFNLDDNADGSGLYEMIEMATQQTDKVNIFTYDGQVTQSDVRVTPATTGRFKAAARVKQNDVQIAVDGTLGTADTSASQPSNIDRMIIGDYSSGDYAVDGPIARIAYYNKGLPNAQLQGLTQQ